MIEFFTEENRFGAVLKHHVRSRSIFHSEKLEALVCALDRLCQLSNQFNEDFVGCGMLSNVNLSKLQS